jgi:hypothetical protein
MNKKIATEIVIGIILIVTVLISSIIWLDGKKNKFKLSQQQLTNSSQTSQPIDKQKAPLQSQNVADQEKFSAIDKLCQQNSVQEFGKIDSNKDILVYETECIIKLYPNNGTDSLIRYYVRDAEGTFNKKIYSVLNEEGFGGGTYGEIKGFQGDKIKIHRIKNGNDSVVIDVSGNESSLTSDEQSYNFSVSLSPNKKFLVKVGSSENSSTSEIKTNHVQVKNIENNDVRDYDFSKQGLNGVYAAGWSINSDSVYIAGGMWEFSAPAKLWKIDILNKSIKEYGGLDDLVFPITIFPNENVAFARSNEGFNEYKNSKVNLYQIDLINGDKKVVANEDAISSFNYMAKIGNNLFFLVSKEGIDSQQLEKLDLKTGKISKLFDGPIRIHNYLANGLIVLQDNSEFSIFFVDSEKKNVIGKGGDIGMRVPTGSKEYVSNIVGWIKN